ncbi:hypothetical protein AYL99_03662 [Fonsecaea erecta]|uniref:Uncharacterized protein n=1 Tax=Fonsecaea erecta TaxID=1367422 RepID=A0A178ZNR8_9EURO|nr:hypothetical protein AYL99_03662 [Fonsecaea erecta]OAP61459.1 hypothetical protein AYL99_03662 [Fonsecaea erecta]
MSPDSECHPSLSCSISIRIVHLGLERLCGDFPSQAEASSAEGGGGGGGPEQSPAHIEADQVASRDRKRSKRRCVQCLGTSAAFITIVLVIVLPVIYVAYPALARNDIESARLVAASLALLSPTPDSFYIEQTAIWISNNTGSATLGAWTADLCVEPQCDYPFARIRVPECKASNGTEVQIDQSVRIANMTEFTKYTQMSFLAAEYHVFLHGSGELHRQGLPSVTIIYEKDITLKGLDGLAGFNVTSFQFISPFLPGRFNAQGTVSIPNLSFSTFDLGSVNMNMSVANIPIGTCSLQNVLLRPGNNTFPMAAVVNQTAIGALVRGSYTTGMLPVDVMGTQVLYNEEEIPWYEQVLQGLTYRVDLNVSDVLQALESAETTPPQPLSLNADGVEGVVARGLDVEG